MTLAQVVDPPACLLRAMKGQAIWTLCTIPNAHLVLGFSRLFRSLTQSFAVLLSDWNKARPMLRFIALISAASDGWDTQAACAWLL